MWKLNRIVMFVLLSMLAYGNLSWAATTDSGSPSAIEQNFQKARRDYLHKDLKAAADEIRRGAAYLKSEAATAVGRGKDVLTKSYQELDKLADDVKSGTVTSVKKIEASFARAYNALAINSHIKSTESWTRKEIVKTGEALGATVNYVERGFAWAGKKTETGTKAVVKKSKDLSQKLKKKAGWVADEVGKGLKDIGNQIEKLGKIVPPTDMMENE